MVLIYIPWDSGPVLYGELPHPAHTIRVFIPKAVSHIYNPGSKSSSPAPVFILLLVISLGPAKLALNSVAKIYMVHILWDISDISLSVDFPKSPLYFLTKSWAFPFDKTVWKHGNFFYTSIIPS
jgi:hypothetical protein